MHLEVSDILSPDVGDQPNFAIQVALGENAKNADFHAQ